jgi:hypothetical protein
MLPDLIQVLKAAAHAVAVTTTTPFTIDVKKPDKNAGINMSCVIEYNDIAKEVAKEVGAAVVDLYGYVEEFCQQSPLLPASSGFGGNYTACAIQSSGLHFFTRYNIPPPCKSQSTSISLQACASTPQLHDQRCFSSPACRSHQVSSTPGCTSRRRQQR